MRIESVRIKNYKSFRDTGPIQMAPAFTVLIGPNNSGKTAFLETLRAGLLQNKPHLGHDRTDEGLPQAVNPNSDVEYDITITGKEIKWRILSSDETLQFPVKDARDPNALSEIETIFASNHLRFKLEFRPDLGWLSVSEPFTEFCPDASFSAYVHSSEDRQNCTIVGVHGSPPDAKAYSNFLGSYFAESTYVFKAERMNVGESAIDEQFVLYPDARNLPSALMHLQADLGRQEELFDHLRAIFPSVYGVTSQTMSGGRARIMVINAERRGGKPRAGVMVPLNDCGSGISQVLAILCVAVTAPASRIIVIDEPTSFLHPGATRKLLQILKQQRHQYIITTHSAEVIRAIEPDLLHLIKWDGHESKFETLDAKKLADARRILQELGVRLSDIFGADNVLWVEGQTEELCFPILLKHAGRASTGTAVVSVTSVGDLESRRPRGGLVWEVYEKLSGASVLVPPALAFSFDREDRSQIQMDDLIRRSKGKVHFLPRRTYENYLLDADAIFAVLRSHIQSDVSLSPVNIADWIAQNGQKYGEIRKGDEEEQKWLAEVRAPDLLSDLFEDLENVRFQKMVHSVSLTEWLIANKPEGLAELVGYVCGLVTQQSE
jgi:predicted ATPase